jgi:hypothetical protein
VSSELTPHSARFNGKIGWVRLDLVDDDNDHFIDPEERLRVVMTRLERGAGGAPVTVCCGGWPRAPWSAVGRRAVP